MIVAKTNVEKWVCVLCRKTYPKEPEPTSCTCGGRLIGVIDKTEKTSAIAWCCMVNRCDHVYASKQVALIHVMDFHEIVGPKANKSIVELSHCGQYIFDVLAHGNKGVFELRCVKCSYTRVVKYFA